MQFLVILSEFVELISAIAGIGAAALVYRGHQGQPRKRDYSKAKQKEKAERSKDA